MILSIVITTRNRYVDLINCLESIEKSKVPEQTEIIVVDDCSNDKTKTLSIKKIKRYSKHATIIHMSKQQMMVKSRNIGAKKANGKYIAFVDDDNLVKNNMFIELVNFANKHGNYGIIGPSMYFSSGEKYLDYQKISMFSGKTSGYIDNTKKTFCDSDGVPNLFLVRRTVFEKCGYFDEDLVQTFTEPDFAFLAKKFGYKCAIVKKAITYHQVLMEDHLKPRGLGGIFKQKAYCLMRNRTIIVLRYGTLIQKIIYLCIFSWIWPFIYSLMVIRQSRYDLMKLYWRGYFDGLQYAISGKITNRFVYSRNEKTKL